MKKINRRKFLGFGGAGLAAVALAACAPPALRQAQDAALLTPASSASDLDDGLNSTPTSKRTPTTAAATTGSDA
ncbi:MAG TPA: twin-arginine translocation signal domain-containing protein, partial [Caldilineae bacterium]|nr:twin-arginine translocation signal domain-containing protein [Caldilineae bacterium]